MKVLFINNFDLFSYSLIEEFEKRGCEAISYRSDAAAKIIDNFIKKFKPGLIVISSGGGGVSQSGNSVDVIRNYFESVPVFGVGLGHQCIIEAFGGKVDRLSIANSGLKASIGHDGKTIFKNISSPFTAGRYNSLAALDVPYTLEVSARDENDTVMGVRHKETFVEGVQFHPESILTAEGGKLVENLIKEVDKG